MLNRLRKKKAAGRDQDGVYLLSDNSYFIDTFGNNTSFIQDDLSQNSSTAVLKDNENFIRLKKLSEGRNLK